DRAVPDRPLLAYRYCGHIAVANTAALDLAGIGPHTADPRGGSLDRDDSGTPTGILRETAVGLVAEAIDPLLPPPEAEAILRAMNALVATGMRRIGAIVAAGGPLWCGVGNELEALCDLADDLPLDVDVLVIADTPEQLDGAADRIVSAGGRLRFRGWKAFADGSLGGHTAAMWEPFDDVDTTGTLRLDPDQAVAMARHVLDLGAESAIHAIGDRAVDVCLDVYQELVGEGFDPTRMRIEHASVTSDAAIERMADLGVVASVQPAFLTSEADWLRSRLGERAPYRFATMQRAGVRMIGGSDCPVERPDPLVGIGAAVNREGLSDDEHLDVATALSLFAAHDLSPGSPADLVVLDASPDDPSATILAVYHDGRPRQLTPLPWPG
ncbi:MAG: amidohydrolase family protein, partial [Acidimicrobiia bacterium]